MATQRNYLQQQILWMAVLDLLCLAVGIVGGVTVRLGGEAIEEYVLENLSVWLYFSLTIVVANYVSGAYGLELRLSRFNMVVNWAFSILAALAMVGATSYAWLHMAVGRGVLGFAILFYSVLWLSGRLLIYQRLFTKEAFGYRVAIIGTGETAQGFLNLVQNRDIRPVHKVVGLILVDGAGNGRKIVREEQGDVPVIECGMAHVASTIRALGADLVMMGVDHEEEIAGILPQLRRLRFEGVPVLTPLDVSGSYSGRVPLRMVDEHWLMHASQGFATSVALRFKRLMDLAIIVLLGVPALLVAMIVALLVKLTGPLHPVLYLQERVGRFGVIFRIYKFRTMKQGAESETGAVWAVKNDPRVTIVGRFLRKYRLDELPQLINVLRGEMSLVGPRPERPELVEKLVREIPYYRERENILPGLTGWAQIRYPYGATTEDARAKLEFDLFYLQNLSVGLDLRIILRTLRIVLFGLEREMR